MNNDDDLGKLLQEIRDTQREHLSEYKRVTQRSLDLQERAVAKQEQFGRLYRRVLAVVGLLVAGFMAYLFLLRQ